MSATLKTLLLDNEPTGTRLVELGNRVIKVYIIPRSRLENSIIRDDLQQSGIYFLVGQDEDDRDTVYIGMATNLAKRFSQHKKDQSKAFWRTAIACTTRDNSLTASATNYLERKCVELSKDAGRMKVHNMNTPVETPVSEIDRAEMDDYLSDIRTILAVFGYTFLEKATHTAPADEEVYYCKGPDAEAEGKLSDEGFVVFSGSKIRIKQTKSLSKFFFNKLSDLQEEDLIETVSDSQGIFTKDVLFNSPSAASSLVLGRSSNGWVEWKNNKGKTLHDVERW